MVELIKRDLKIYYRDKATVFFSLLTVIITISLYILFLAKLQIDTIKSALVGYEITDKNLSWIVNTWITAGLLSIVPITSSLATLGVMVQDKEKKVMMDFKSMPMKAYKYPLAVIFAATIIGFLMGCVAFCGYSIYIYIKTSELFTAYQIFMTLFLILVTALFSSTLMGFLATFFKTNSGFSALNVVVGTIIGFLNVVYVPMGVLPTYIQKLVKFVPSSHIAVLFRNILMKNALFSTFNMAPAGARDYYCEMYAIDFYNDAGKIMDHRISWIYVSLCIVVSFVLFIVCFNHKEKEF